MSTLNDREAKNASRTPAPTLVSRLELGLEISKAIILSLTALLTAWCGYQSSRFSGLMATDFSRANTQRLAALNVTVLSVQVLQADLSLFNAWLDADASGDTERSAAIEHLFSTQLRAAFAAWQALGETPSDANRGVTPFDMPEYTGLPEDTISGFQAQAEAHFNAALTANGISDNYVLNTVLLALGLFLTGISDQFRRVSLRIAMRVMAVLIILSAFVTLLSYPIT